MNLRLSRRWLTERSTIGELSSDGELICFSLEDVVRPPGEKVPGKTAIPAGRYEVAITHSPRFDIEMPLLLDVPGFQGVRIHWGNDADDTEGCLLVGQVLHLPDEILQSRAAYAVLFARLVLAKSKGERIFITITNDGA